MDRENKEQKERDALLREILEQAGRPVGAPPVPKPIVSHAAEETGDVTSNEIPQMMPYTEPELEQTQSYATASNPRYVAPAPEPAQPVAHVKTYSAAETAQLYADLDGISQSETQSVSTPKKKQKRKKRRKGRVISALLITIGILAISIGISVMAITYGRDLLGINNDSKTKIVDIPAGSNTEDIANILKEAGIIAHPKLFVLFAGMSDKDSNFTAGEHEVRPDMAYETLFEELASPAMNEAGTVQITFQEGITLREAADILESTGVCDADNFIDFFNKDAKYGYTYESYLPSFINEKFYPMEGYLFPDTYIFYEDMDVDLVCQKILENFNQKISPEYYERLETLGISLDQMLTLASIIQAEAGTVEQMSRISSVFWNRLNHATEYPKLQSDPTSNYVEEVIKPNIKEANPEMYNAYDTYEGSGLPPGAICNPGLDAIRAALYPADTDYYFFYANLDTRETYFSRTLQEHEAVQKRVEGSRVTTANGETGTTTQAIAGVGTSENTEPATDENGELLTSTTETKENEEDEE